MDGTFGGGDLISASLAIMLGGGTDAELHDKEVTLTTSDVTGSQTAIFEYDPQNEPVTGTPPGPWDGYSLFTIDLSGVKDDIEDLQQQIADLEDELEACHDCRDEVVVALQQYDPTYDPAEGECPADKVTEVVYKVEELEEQVEECNECKAAVIAKLQEYDPDFDPQTCEDIPPEIDEVAGYEFPENTPKEKIDEITGLDTVFDPEFDYYVKYYSVLDGRYGSDNNHIYKYGNIYERLEYQDPGAGNAIGFHGYIEVYNRSDNTLVDRCGLGTWEGMLYGGCYGYYDNIVFDPTTGTYTMNENYYTPEGGGRLITRTVTYQNNLLIGYGTSGKWKVKNS